MHRLLLAGAALALVLALTSAQNDCSMLEPSQLGNTTEVSDSGFVASALGATGDGTPSVQIVASNTVCLGQGTLRGSYRSISLIVRIRRSDNTEENVQLHLQCENGQWSTNNFGFIAQSISNNPAGNLSTALRTDCIACVSPVIAKEVSSEEHCLG